MIRSLASESWDSLCRDVEQLRNMLNTKNNYVSTYKYLQATMSYLKLKNFLYNNSVILCVISRLNLNVFRWTKASHGICKTKFQ